MSGEILEIKEKFLVIMEIYTKKLSRAGAIRGNDHPNNFTKWAILEVLPIFEMFNYIFICLKYEIFM